MGCWGDSSDPRISTIPWNFIPCTPDRNNAEEVNNFKSDQHNKFGAWKFEEACIRSRCDFVLAIRDAWHDQFQITSPFRNYYNLIWSPAVDAMPQREEWLSWYSQCDAILGYTKWGADLLKSSSKDNINVVGHVSPVCDDVFIPVQDKNKHKESMGFPPNAKVIGTVMRNQKRKDFPNLFAAFEKYLLKNNINDTYLYCHTSYPDAGFDIPHLLKNSKVSHKIIFTYVCKNCNNVTPTFFRDSVTFCHKCGQSAMCMTNTNVGVSNEVLSAIYNTFDLYVQYARLGALEMPQVEAAACGIPIMSVDYSAMSEVVRNLGGSPIQVLTLDKEMESNRLWAIPDNEHFIGLLEDFFAKTKLERTKLGFLSRQKFEQNYGSWERVGKKWYDTIKSLPLNKKPWNSPPNIHIPSTANPGNCSNKEFVQWLLTDVLGEPERIGTFMETRLIRDLNFGCTYYGLGGLYYNEDSYEGKEEAAQEFNRDHAYNHMVQLCERRNFWERMRVNNVE